MEYLFGWKRDAGKATRDAIVTLRQQLQMIEKKEEYLQRKIEEDVNKAKANVVSNKALAMRALQRKKGSEAELDRLGGTRLQLEQQINTLESANLNVETMQVMRKAADALSVIHNKMTVDKVDKTMADIAEQKDIADEIAAAISTSPQDLPTDEELNEELRALEGEVLDERLANAQHVPVHMPPIIEEHRERKAIATTTTDEEDQLRALQAELAM